MKKYLTILMAVLCLVTFSVSDADAKKRNSRNKTQSTNREFLLDANLIGCAYGECGGFEITLHLNGPTGTVGIGDYNYKASVVSFRNNKVKIKFNLNNDVGYLDAKIDEAFAGDIYVLIGNLYYKSRPSNKIPFELVDTSAGFKYPC